MAFTYNDDLSDNISIVRFDIGDSNEDAGPRPDSTNYSDAEITAIIAVEGNTGKAAARMFEILASEWTAVAGRVDMADYKEDLSKRAEFFMEQAKKWRSRYGDSVRRAAITQQAPTRVDGFSDDIDSDDT